MLEVKKKKTPNGGWGLSPGSRQSSVTPISLPCVETSLKGEDWSLQMSQPRY